MSSKIFVVINQVNASGQFVGVAEMLGPVDFKKDMKFWKLDKYNGFFPIKWHIIKDVPNCLFRHIILKNNDNRCVTFSRDTQEVILTFDMLLTYFIFYRVRGI
jgi:YTH domain-containing family protein